MPSLSTFAVSAAAFAVAATAQQFVMYTPGGDDTSVERIDPILAPGSIGQHVHQVFGSNALAPEVSYESLLSSTCTTIADSSNNGNAADHSIYWHPALFMEAADNSGYIRVPTGGHKLYYKNAGSQNDVLASPFEFPHGFRMIAGNPWIRSPPSDLQQQNITQWICHDTSGTNQGTYGGFPTGVTDCDATDGFNGALHFPHCWNGQAFNPANPTAHTSYPTGDIENGVCPSSHPTRLPHIFIENTFNIHAVVDQVKPNTFVLAQGDNTGLGWHADFFNGWEDGAIPALFGSCPYNEYGNEDVGECTAFRKTSTPASDCRLSGFFAENVNAPRGALPGCNPIVDTNPAPIYAVAPLGTYSTDCTLASDKRIADTDIRSSNASASSVSSATSPTTYSSASSSVAVNAETADVTESTSESTSTPTTLATFTLASSQTKKVGHPHVTKSASPSDAYSGKEVVYLTQYVTVTATSPNKRHAAAHLRRHRDH